MEDPEIIDLYFQRDQQAIAETDRKYGPLLRSLAAGILTDPRDREESLSDCYLGAWNTIPPQRPDPLRSYLCRLLRNAALKLRRHLTAKKCRSVYDLSLEELSEVLSGPGDPQEDLALRELTRAVEAFLRRQSRENRAVFLRRYWLCQSARDIGAAVGLSEKAVTVRLTRLRQRLRTELIREGVLE